MKFIILSRGGGESLTLDSHRMRHRLILLGFGLVPFLVGALSLWYAISIDRQSTEKALLDNWQQELAFQASLVEQTRAQVGDELSALTVKVAELQARIMRLDVLGQQVAQIAKLDNGEFDFSRQPALGGPEVVDGSLNSPFNSAVTTTDLPSLLINRSKLSLMGNESQFATNDSAESRLVPGSSTSLSLEQMLDNLISHIDNRGQQLALLDRQLAARESRIDSFVAGKPVVKGWMSSAYGSRTDPFSGKQAWHAGVDFAGKAGADVVAVAGGIVTIAAKRTGYGNIIELSHGNGFVTRYGHNEAHLVELGDVVSKGQVIAQMGSSGRSTGPHVHFEVLKQGKAMNPERYIYRASL